MLMTIGMIVSALGLVALLLNVLDFYNLPENCTPQNYNCQVLEDNFNQDRRERFAVTAIGITAFLLGWAIWRLHKILAPEEKNWS